jgi:hypothetical protein
MYNNVLLSGIAIAVALIARRLLFMQLGSTKQALRHIPELRFDENDTADRYLTDSRMLLLKGREKVCTAPILWSL